jgi:anti-sigma regulatory factor (Ser/Thr protein kinase)/serine/threonine protein phosphatase PrpC
MEKRFLIARWLGSYTQSIPIYDEASVSSARQRVREAGDVIHAGKDLVETVALLASDLTHNQLTHSKQGYFAVRHVERGAAKGLEIIAADLGPGIAKPILTDSSRAEGSLGAGLESVFRLADEVEIDTRRAEGLCVVARKFEGGTPEPFETAVAGEPYPGELISGDDAVCLRSESGFLAAVCDGLGHGPEAREASKRAVESIARNRDLDLREIVLTVHSEISGSRGCALSIARFHKQTATLQCLSAGDVRSHLYYIRDTHFFTSTPLVIGEAALSPRRLRIEEATIAPGSVFAMFTDGLETKATLKGQLDLLRRPAIVIAQHLIESHSRRTDDSLVFVARFRR